MAGYAKRTIRLDFPELAEDGDEIYVVIRNPKTVPPGELVAKARRLPAAAPDAEGGEGETEMDADEALSTTNEIFARLIVRWHVYDGTSTEDEQPVLGLPATPADVGKLPLEILNAIGEELAKANPQKRTESQEATTSIS